MEFCVYDRGHLTIRMPREVDHHASSKIRCEADRVIDLYPVRQLVFDFAGTEFMDSSGVGVIIGRAKKMGYRKGDVSAANLSGRAEKIFRISGLDKLVRIERREECMLKNVELSDDLRKDTSAGVFGIGRMEGQDGCDK